MKISHGLLLLLEANEADKTQLTKATEPKSPLSKSDQGTMHNQGLMFLSWNLNAILASSCSKACCSLFSYSQVALVSVKHAAAQLSALMFELQIHCG